MQWIMSTYKRGMLLHTKQKQRLYKTQTETPVPSRSTSPATISSEPFQFRPSGAFVSQHSLSTTVKLYSSVCVQGHITG